MDDARLIAARFELDELEAKLSSSMADEPEEDEFGPLSSRRLAIRLLVGRGGSSPEGDLAEEAPFGNGVRKGGKTRIKKSASAGEAWNHGRLPMDSFGANHHSADFAGIQDTSTADYGGNSDYKARESTSKSELPLLERISEEDCFRQSKYDEVNDSHGFLALLLERVRESEGQQAVLQKALRNMQQELEEMDAAYHQAQQECLQLQEELKVSRESEACLEAERGNMRLQEMGLRTEIAALRTLTESILLKGTAIRDLHGGDAMNRLVDSEAADQQQMKIGTADVSALLNVVNELSMKVAAVEDDLDAVIEENNRFMEELEEKTVQLQKMEKALKITEEERNSLAEEMKAALETWANSEASQEDIPDPNSLDSVEFCAAAEAAVEAAAYEGQSAYEHKLSSGTAADAQVPIGEVIAASGEKNDIEDGGRWTRGDSRRGRDPAAGEVEGPPDAASNSGDGPGRSGIRCSVRNTPALLLNKRRLGGRQLTTGDILGIDGKNIVTEWLEKLKLENGRCAIRPISHGGKVEAWEGQSLPAPAKLSDRAEQKSTVVEFIQPNFVSFEQRGGASEEQQMAAVVKLHHMQARRAALRENKLRKSLTST